MKQKWLEAALHILNIHQENGQSIPTATVYIYLFSVYIVFVFLFHNFIFICIDTVNDVE